MRPTGNGDARAETDREITQHFGFVPQFYDTLPAAARDAGWAVQRDLELGDTAIPQKYKELIGLAVAAHIKCRYCIYFHGEAARAFGATDEELKEACAMGGMTVQFSNAITGMRYDFDLFKAEVDRALEHATAHAGQQQPSPPTL